MPKRTSKEFDRFAKLTDRLLAVPHDEILRRSERYKKAVERNPRKRGPKRKAT